MLKYQLLFLLLPIDYNDVSFIVNEKDSMHFLLILSNKNT